MSRRDEYEQKAEAMLAPIVEEAGFELVDTLTNRAESRLMTAKQ